MITGAVSAPEEKYAIRQIFSLAFDVYRDSASLSAEQPTAAHCIMKCRTGELGHNYYRCSECGAIKIVPRSCGNRNCPSCQAVNKEVWLEERKGELIDDIFSHTAVSFRMADLSFYYLSRLASIISASLS